MMGWKIVVAGALIGMAGAGPARAECTDPGEPGVDWRSCFFDRQDLRAVDLTGAKLRDASFKRADLRGAILSNVNAFRAKFVSSKSSKAKFDGARLAEADLTKADLTGASFRNADLRRARLFRAILRGADMTGAKMRGADILKADLTGATWIDGKRVCAEGSIGKCR